MSPLLAGVVWGLAGIPVGVLVRRASVRLARLEELEPGFERWQVYGPPALAAVLFGLFGWRFGATPVMLIKSLWVVVLVQVIFFDLEHHLILDRVLLPAGVLALLLSFVTPNLGWLQAVLTGLGAGLVFLLIALLGSMVFRAEAMGLGDVKFSAYLGLILGFPLIVYSLVGGVFLAGVTALGLVALRIRKMNDSIAYGPFLAIGALLGLFVVGGGRP